MHDQIVVPFRLVKGSPDTCGPILRLNWLNRTDIFAASASYSSEHVCCTLLVKTNYSKTHTDEAHKRGSKSDKPFCTRNLYRIRN